MAADRTKLDAFLSRCKRRGYCYKSVAAICDVFSNVDDSLFESRLLTQTIAMSFTNICLTGVTVTQYAA